MEKNNKTIKLIAGTAIVCVFVLGFVYNKILKPGVVVDVCAQEAAKANLTKNESTLNARSFEELKYLEEQRDKKPNLNETAQRCIKAYLGK